MTDSRPTKPPPPGGGRDAAPSGASAPRNQDGSDAGGLSHAQARGLPPDTAAAAAGGTAARPRGPGRGARAVVPLAPCAGASLVNDSVFRSLTGGVGTSAASMLALPQVLATQAQQLGQTLPVGARGPSPTGLFCALPTQQAAGPRASVGSSWNRADWKKPMATAATGGVAAATMASSEKQPSVRATAVPDVQDAVTKPSAEAPAPAPLVKPRPASPPPPEAPAQAAAAPPPPPTPAPDAGPPLQHEQPETASATGPPPPQATMGHEEVEGTEAAASSANAEATARAASPAPSIEPSSPCPGSASGSSSPRPLSKEPSSSGPEPEPIVEVASAATTGGATVAAAAAAPAAPAAPAPPVATAKAEEVSLDTKTIASSSSGTATSRGVPSLPPRAPLGSSAGRAALQPDRAATKVAGHALPAEFPCSPTDCSLAWRALGCYTCLRTMSRFLALSPFPPLALLRGLCAPQRSVLIDDVHVHLLRVLARRLRPPKLPSASAKCEAWGFLDRTNWPTYFRFYVNARQDSAWSIWEDAAVIWAGWEEETELKAVAMSRQLAARDWHEVSVATRVGVLEYLCNRLMELPEVTALLGARGAAYDHEAVERGRFADKHADSCGVCGLGGDLLLCDACPAVYHHGCVGERTRDLPLTWICPECRLPDPAYYAARVPEHYCRVAFRSQPGREETWTLRVVHGFVFRQVTDGRPAVPQLLSPSEVYHLLKQLGPTRANRWPFSQLRRPPDIFEGVGDGVGDAGPEAQVAKLSPTRALLRSDEDPTIPQYALATILDIPLGRPLGDHARVKHPRRTRALDAILAKQEAAGSHAPSGFEADDAAAAGADADAETGPETAAPASSASSTTAAAAPGDGTVDEEGAATEDSSRRSEPVKRRRGRPRRSERPVEPMPYSDEPNVLSRPKRSIRKPAIFRGAAEQEESSPSEADSKQQTGAAAKAKTKTTARPKKEEAVPLAETAVTSRGRRTRKPASYREPSDDEGQDSAGSRAKERGVARRTSSRSRKGAAVTTTSNSRRGGAGSSSQAAGKTRRRRRRWGRRTGWGSSSSEEDEEEEEEDEDEEEEEEEEEEGSDFVPEEEAAEYEDDDDEEEEDWVVRSKASTGRKQHGEESEEEGEHGGLPDDPDDYLAASAPEVHRVRQRARAQAEADPSFFNPFLYANKYRFNEASDAKHLVLPLVRGSWRPRFAFPSRPILDISHVAIRARVEAAVKPLPQVAHLPRFDNRAAYVHLEKAKDMLLQLESELRGLLLGPWERGTAVINAWGERVYMSRSVAELGRTTALLVESAHPRAFVACWHATRPGGFSCEPTQLGRAPAREDGPLVGASSKVPRLKNPVPEVIDEGGKWGTAPRPRPNDGKRLKPPGGRTPAAPAVVEDVVVGSQPQGEPLPPPPPPSSSKAEEKPRARLRVAAKGSAAGAEEAEDLITAAAAGGSAEAKVPQAGPEELEALHLDEEMGSGGEKGAAGVSEPKRGRSDEAAASPKGRPPKKPREASKAPADDPPSPLGRSPRQSAILAASRLKQQALDEAKRRKAADEEDSLRRDEEEEEDEDDEGDGGEEEEGENKGKGARQQAPPPPPGDLDAAELAEPEANLVVWGGRVFELGLDEDGRVELMVARKVMNGGTVADVVRVKNMRGGRRFHRWEERASLPRTLLRRMARRPPLKNAGPPPPGVHFPHRQPNRLPRVAMSHLFAYRAQHVRTAADLEQLLRVLDHCLDHDRLRELTFYPGVLKGVRPACHPDAHGGLEYLYHRLGREGVAGEWVHEDSLDLRLVKTYRRTVIDEANAEAARAFRKRKAKTEGRMRKLVVGFKKRTQEFWQEVKGRFVALLPLKEDEEEDGGQESAEALVDAVAATPAGRALFQEARDGWKALYEEFKNKSLEQQRKLWRLEHRPAWDIQMRSRTYGCVDPEPQIAHDLKELRAQVTAEVRKRLQRRRCAAVMKEEVAHRIELAVDAAAATATATAAADAPPC